MDDLIKTFLQRLREKRITIRCIGDPMIDAYYKVNVDRISPEFPMPIMTSDTFHPVIKMGGVANVFKQLSHFNVDAKLNCFYDSNFENVLGSEHVLMSRSLKIDGLIPIKNRFLHGDIQVTRWDVEKPLFGLSDITSYRESLKRCLDGVSGEVVLISDYGKGTFPIEGDWLKNLASRNIVVVDPKKGDLEQWRGCTIFKLNEAEAIHFTGERDVLRQTVKIRSVLGCEAVVVTRGPGLVYSLWGEEIKAVVNSVRVRSVVGAGDCFLAGLGMAVGHGFKGFDALNIAKRMGELYVQGVMNNPLYPIQLYQSKFVDPKDFKERDFKLVFANGCFDLLHSGHISTLNYAKSRGDKLVVALNSDDSVRRIKGKDRPIIDLEQRMKMIASLEIVDYVVSFSEDTPDHILDIIKPDLIVKGSQYSKEEIVGADRYNVDVAPMEEGLSTSNIIQLVHSQKHSEQ